MLEWLTVLMLECMIVLMLEWLTQPKYSNNQAFKQSNNLEIA